MSTFFLLKKRYKNEFVIGSLEGAVRRTNFIFMEALDYSNKLFQSFLKDVLFNQISYLEVDPF
jgi:hypothetical protein